MAHLSVISHNTRAEVKYKYMYSSGRATNLHLENFEKIAFNRRNMRECRIVHCFIYPAGPCAATLYGNRSLTILHKLTEDRTHFATSEIVRTVEW